MPTKIIMEEEASNIYTAVANPKLIIFKQSQTSGVVFYKPKRKLVYNMTGVRKFQQIKITRLDRDNLVSLYFNGLICNNKLNSNSPSLISNQTQTDRTIFNIIQFDINTFDIVDVENNSSFIIGIDEKVGNNIKMRLTSEFLPGYFEEYFFNIVIDLSNIYVHMQENAIIELARNISFVSDVQPMISGIVVTSFSARDYSNVEYHIIDDEAYGSSECNYHIISENPLLYQSNFYKSPRLNKVIKGKACFVVDKLQEIINHYELNINIVLFSERIALYGFLKYILAFLMYKKFSLIFLTGDFNKRFMEDLEEKFPQYLKYFEDPIYGIVGYNKYFRSTIKSK